MIVRDYPVKPKKLKQMKRTFYVFLVGSILCWIITIYRWIKGGDVKWMLIACITSSILAVVYYTWPKRAHFTIDDKGIVDYSDGFIKHYHFDITKCYNFSYKKSTQRLLGMDDHYYRMTIPFIFGEENFDDFVKHIYYLKVKAMDADAANAKYRAERAEKDELERREKIRKKKKKEKEKAKKIAEKEGKTVSEVLEERKK